MALPDRLCDKEVNLIHRVDEFKVKHWAFLQSLSVRYVKLNF